MPVKLAGDAKRASASMPKLKELPGVEEGGGGRGGG